MTATIIDGNAIAQQVLDEVRARRRAAARRRHRAGPRRRARRRQSGSVSYVRGKARDAAAVGMRSETIRVSADISQDGLLGLVADLNADPRWHGIIVQLPLPPHIDETLATSAVCAGEGRRRPAPDQRRAPVPRRAGVRLVHAARRDPDAAAHGQRPGGQARRRLRPLEPRRQAAGRAADAEAARRQRDGHRLPHRARPISACTRARRTSSSPSWGGRGRSRRIWCAKAPSSSMSASTPFRMRRRRTARASSATSTTTRWRRRRRRSRRFPAASGPMTRAMLLYNTVLGARRGGPEAASAASWHSRLQLREDNEKAGPPEPASSSFLPWTTHRCFCREGRSAKPPPESLPRLPDPRLVATKASGAFGIDSFPGPLLSDPPLPPRLPRDSSAHPPGAAPLNLRNLAALWRLCVLRTDEN